MQGITKLIMTLQLLWPKTKRMPIELTKNGTDSSYLGSDRFVKHRGKKHSHAKIEQIKKKWQKNN